MAKINLPTTVRTEAFSDAVIAIAITIMVLELKIPDRVPEGMDAWQGLIRPQLSKFVAYVLSFVMIAILWVNHHQLIHTARYATPPLLWYNIQFLFWIALIPLSTAWVGGDFHSPYAVATYGFVLCACMTAWWLLRRHVKEAKYTDRKLEIMHEYALKKTVIAAALYALSVPLAFVSVYISLLIFFSVPAVFFWPDPLPVAKK